MTTVLSLLMLTAIALVAGAIFLWRTRGWGKQVALMLVLAAVMAVNVAIWTLPNERGHAPIGQTLE